MSTLLSSEEHQVAVALQALTRVNPFSPARKDAERQALGAGFVEGPEVWSLGEEGGDNPNLEPIAEVAEDLADRMRRRLQRRAATPDERDLFAALVFMVLYNRVQPELTATCVQRDWSGPPPVVAVYDAYLTDFQRFFRVCGPPDPEVDTPEHLFACFFQIRRAFDLIFGSILGGSKAAAGLRAATWQSIFSFDAGRYRRFLFEQMHQVPTLITGPTGTGKELVARAVSQSLYIPFDAQRRRFRYSPTFLPLNLSAMPTTLLESELFGHRKGAFTGAVADREGWLAACPRGGAVFLDEIGDLEPMLQVKLLRVLEERRFTPVGDTTSQPFEGKIIAATHVDLPGAIAEGRFRRDLYYRLWGDRIDTPALRTHLAGDPGELRRMLRALVARQVPELEVEEVTAEVVREVERSRGPEYGWPGNVRELAQCVRTVLVQGHCPPPDEVPEASGAGGPFSDLEQAALSLEQVQHRYTRHVYERHGSYKAAGEVLGVDWRTVRAWSATPDEP